MVRKLVSVDFLLYLFFLSPRNQLATKFLNRRELPRQGLLYRILRNLVANQVNMKSQSLLEPSLSWP